MRHDTLASRFPRSGGFRRKAAGKIWTRRAENRYIFLDCRKTGQDDESLITSQEEFSPAASKAGAAMGVHPPKLTCG